MADGSVAQAVRVRHGRRWEPAAVTGVIRVVVAGTAVDGPAVAGAFGGPGFAVVAAVEDAASAIGACVQFEPDVCVLHAGVTGGAVSACRTIHEERPDVLVVVLAARLDGDLLVDLVAAGAVGYLLEGTPPDRLAAAVRGVVAGEAVLPRPLVARVVEELRSRPTRRFHLGRRGARLTVRELEVLDLMAAGLSTSAIAERLALSATEVRGHTNAIIRKLAVADRRAAIDLVLDGREGLDLTDS